MKLLVNPFDKSLDYRQIILKSKLLNFKKKTFSGKSLACLFLTRFCGVGCPFCFFKSAPSWRKQNIEDQFSDEGIEKFIEFSQKANLGYLLVSGGGEPLNQRQHILRLIEKVSADRIVLVTSGNWSKNYATGLKYIEDIYNAFKKRTSPTKLVVRVSISEGHSIKLGVDCALNVINVFDKYFRDEKDFCVQIKSFENDRTLGDLLAKLPDVQISDGFVEMKSDNEILMKSIPKKYTLTLSSGYKIIVGVSSIFLSSIKPDLNEEEKLGEAIKIFEEDLVYSENNNPCVVYNDNGSEGLDWSISYNGNICVWQNQVRDTYMNLYEDSYEEILETYIEDPISYSVIDKGRLYRDKIIAEVNSRAVLRAKAVGLRDSVGAVLFEEEKTRLYYTIRVMQDYIQEGKLQAAVLEKWPPEILSIVNYSKDELIELYHQSSSSIVEQQKRKKFNETEWYDFLELIKLGHYALSQEEIREALDFYNKHSVQKVSNLTSIEPQLGEVVRRLTDRLTYIKPLRKFLDMEEKVKMIA